MKKTSRIQVLRDLGENIDRLRNVLKLTDALLLKNYEVLMELNEKNKKKKTVNNNTFCAYDEETQFP